jgi:GntR family transcriptional repressor for pyruvate dehydrogenase complex
MVEGNKKEALVRERSPVPRTSLSDALIQRVLDLIRNENLNPGDRLPSVRSMAERFSVAAPTMREALRRLQTSGVVELRHGSGVYVRNSQERMVLANPNRSELDVVTILDLLDARLLIEPYLVRLTVAKLGDAGRTELGTYLNEANRYLDGSNDDVLQETNMAFHSGIARFSGNSVLGQSLESLLELYSAEQRVILTVFADRCRDYREHRAILDAIRDGDPDEAVELMRTHLEGVKSTVKRNWPGERQ